MGPAAVLSVLVKAEGISETAAKIETVQADLEKAKRSADTADGSFRKLGGKTGLGNVSSDLRDVDQTLKKVNASAGDVDRAAKRVPSSFSGWGAARKAVDDLGGGLKDVDKGIQDVDGSSRNGSGGINTFTNALSNVPGAFGPISGSIAFAIPLLAAFVTELFAVIAALGPLVGLGAAAGVGLAAAAQGFGVLKLATSGIGAALKEQTTNTLKTGSAAISSAQQQRTAARQIQAAQDAVRSAKEQVTSATQRLAQAELSERNASQAVSAARQAAVRNLQDLHTALTDSAVAESRAILTLQDAKQALAQVLAGSAPEDVAKAQQAVTEALHSQQQAAINLTAAQTAYNAVIGNSASTDAQKAQALADLNSAQDAVTDSAFTLTDAQVALQKLQAGPTAEDKAKALIDVADAQNGVTKATEDRKRAQKDANTADQQGVAGSKQVVAAQQALKQAQQSVADAHRAVADAQRQVTRASQQVSDAQKNAADSANKAADGAGNLNKAMSALPPAAQAFVRQLVSMKPKLDDLRNTAAAGLFPGVVTGLKDAERNFNPLKHVVGDTASVLGTLATKAGELVGSKGFGQDIGTIGHRNEIVLSRMGDAALHIVDAIRHLLVAAGPLTTWIAKATDEWARNLDASAKAGEETGRLAGFFQKTKSVMQETGDILKNLAGGFFGLGKGANATGQGILKSLDAVTARFNAWANSAKGQNSIAKFFHDSDGAMRQIIPALGQITKSFGGLAFSVLPVYARILSTLGPAAGPIVQAFVAWKIAATGAAIATGVLNTAMLIFDEEADANPIGLITLAIEALIVAVVLLVTHWNAVQHVLTAGVNAVKNAAVSAFNWIKGNWPLLLAILTGPFGLAALEVVRHWNDIVTFFQGIPAAIVNAIQAGATALVNLGAWVLDQIVGGFKAVTNALAGVGSWLLHQLEGLVHADLNALTALGTWELNAIMKGFRVVTSLLSGAGSWLLHELETVVHATLGSLGALGTWVLTQVVGGFKTVTGGLGSVGSWLLGKLKDLFNGVKDGITGIGGTIIGWIVDGLKSGVNVLIGFLNSVIHIINKLPGVNIGDIKPLKKAGAATADAAGAQGLYQGGVVNSPMVMMGEEAPAHPEFVIPTNPAYRSRAQMLLGAAAKAVGLAQGGSFVSTAYGPPWGGIQGNGVTATGVNLTQSPHLLGVAVDPSVIKLGTMLKINPNPFGTSQAFKAFDTGGDIKQNRIDFYDWKGRADQQAWGVRNVNVDPQGGGGGLLHSIGNALSGAGNALAGLPSDVANLVKDGGAALLGQLPGVGDLPDWLKGLGHYVLGKATSFIKDKIGGLLGLGGGGAPSGVAGLGTFQGLQVASWIIPELQYAARHGWHGRITSGYRPGFDPHTQTGTSEHQGTQYPHGAVDFGGMIDPAGLANKKAFERASVGYNGRRLLEAMGFRDDGHMSGTGHAIGGILGKAGGALGGLPFAGSFGDGGIVGGPLGQPALAVVHGGEAVGQPGQPLEITLIVEDGAVDPDKIRVIANDEAVKVTRTAARLGSRNLPSRGGGRLS